MTPARGPFLAAWLTYWRTMRRYHRFETTGLEHLDGREARLIVGYHGRGVAHDVCMLGVTIFDRHGYLPHGIVHAAARHLPVARRVVEELRLATGDDEVLAEAVRAGEHIVCTPGGTREGCRSHATRYRVDWGHRIG